MILADRYWSDWINPLMIKELRQGLRDRIFIFSLFGMQYLMAFLVFFQLIGVNGDQSSAADIFHSVMWCTFIGILPIRGFFNYSVANEVKQNTMESLMLSTMGARGIVFGKWISQVFQTFLAVVIILPFIIIQYWVGGTDITDNLEQLSIAFFLNGILSAVVIGISCIQFSFMRLGTLFAAGAGVYWGWQSIYNNMTPTVMQELFVLSLCGFFMVPFMIFEVAAVYIAISDSSPMMRRSSYLGLFIAGWCYLQSSDLGTIATYSLVFTLFCAQEAFQPVGLKEKNPTHLSSRFFACFFSQTPLSGLFFATVSVPFIIFLGFYSRPGFDEAITGAPSLEVAWITQYAFALEGTNIVLGVVFLPLLIAELFLKRFSSIRIFTVVLINLAIVGITGLLFTSLPPAVPSLWLGLFPTAACNGLIVLETVYDDPYHYTLAVATLGMVTNVAGFIALSSVYLRKMNSGINGLK